MGVILLTLAIVLAAGSFSLSLFFPSRGDVSAPSCGTNRTMVLMAQAVPSATKLPCIRSLPLGWSLSSSRIVRGRVSFQLLVMGGSGGNGSIQVDGGGEPVVDVSLVPTCPSTGGDPSITASDVGGGCVTYRSSLPAGVGPVPSFDPGGGLSYVSRSLLGAFIERDDDQRLCGAGVACP